LPSPLLSSVLVQVKLFPHTHLSIQGGLGLPLFTAPRILHVRLWDSSTTLQRGMWLLYLGDLSKSFTHNLHYTETLNDDNHWLI